MPSISILIVSKPEVGKVLTQYLTFEPELEVIGIADSIKAATAYVVKMLPDVILIGFPLPDLHQLNEISQLNIPSPKAPVVALVIDAMPLDWASVSSTVKAILLQPVNPPALFEAVRYAAQHDQYLPQRLYGQVRISAIAQTFDITPDTVSTVVGRLAQSGLMIPYTYADVHPCVVGTTKGGGIANQPLGKEADLSALEYEILKFVSDQRHNQSFDQPNLVS